MTPEEKLRRLKEAYASPNRTAITDAFYGDELAKDRFTWCSIFLTSADPITDVKAIDRLYDKTLTAIMLGS